MRSTLERVHSQLEELMRVRDEMKTRLGLQDDDAKDRWELIEQKWDQVAEKVGVLGQSPAPTHELERTTEELLDEIRDGYMGFAEEEAA